MPQDTGSSVSLGALRVGLLSSVQSLDPLHAQDFASAMVVLQIYETPYARPTRHQPARPLLFGEPLQSDAEQRVFSAPVRGGVCFSDGTPLTAERMAHSLRKAAPMREQAEIETDGDRVVFRLARPNARFDLVLTQTFAAVTLEKDGEMLGTGPYVAAPDSTPERMHLVANPRHEPAPGIEEIVFTCFPPDESGQPTALVEAIQAGEVDFTNMLPRDQVSGLERVRKYFELGNSVAFLYFNTERSGLADPRLRKAICLALDRLDLASLSHTHALAHTAASVVPPMMSGWRDGLAPHPEQARALISELGDAKPERLSMLVMFGPRPYLPHPMRAAAYITERVGELGIAIEPHQAKDSSDYYHSVAAGDYDLALSGWIADTADPADFLESTLSSEAIPQPDQPISIEANLSRWKSARADAALRELRREPDEAKLHEILQLARDEVPAFPLMYGAISFVHSWRVKNFEPPPLGIPHFSELELRELL